jgi:hypothetical protein
MNDIYITILNTVLTFGMGLVAWLLQGSVSKLNKLAIEVAVIKSMIETIKEDHENLIIINEKLKKHEADIKAAHDKLRQLKKED